MTTQVIITVPIPSRTLSSNTRAGWRAVAAATKKARKLAYLLARQATGKAALRWNKASVLIELRKTGRFPDPCNFFHWLKPHFDGIQDAEVIVNDSQLWPERPVFTKVKRGEECVVLTITREE